MSTEHEDQFEIINDSQVNTDDGSERIIETFDNAEDLYPQEEDSSSSSEED